MAVENMESPSRVADHSEPYIHRTRGLQIRCPGDFRRILPQSVLIRRRHVERANRRAIHLSIYNRKIQEVTTTWLLHRRSTERSL